VFLYGPLATHRRGTVLREAFGGEVTTTLPDARAVVFSFADAFQGSSDAEQTRLVEWTRAAGHLLVLLPPFAAGTCERPVAWRAERMESAPRGGEGLGIVLSAEVTHRLDGKLQTPSIAGATWSDLSVCTATYRLHPAAGLFAVTCLPVWSLSALDAPDELEKWLAGLVALAGDTKLAESPDERPLHADHYGLLVFLLSKDFSDEEQAIAALRSQAVFRFTPEQARALLSELRVRGLVNGAVPTTQATQLVMQSPYAPYVNALREVTP
jgi:hypothetical protein